MSDDDGGTFADQLADLEIDVDEQEEQDGEKEESGRPDEAEPEQKSEEELFREAVAGLDDEEIRRAKYDEPESEESEPEESDEESEPPTTSHTEASDDPRMAEAFGDLEIDADELPEERESDPREADQRPDFPRETSEREEFEQAIEGLSRAEMRRQKYDLPTAKKTPAEESDDSSGDSSPDPEQKRREEKQREELKRRRQERKFEAAMRDVEPIEKDRHKYRAPQAPDPSTYFDASETQRTAADFVTPTLPKSGDGLNDIAPLGDAQKALLERAEAAEKRGELPELNLRGETSDEAADRLREFAERCRQQEVEFARIIPGRGANSDSDPVLKPLVLEWLETAAVDDIRGYAPERQFAGDYGSLIVEFRRVPEL